jgi:hypothetical protein
MDKYSHSELLEFNSFNRLKKNENKMFSWHHEGGSDSTVSDIRVTCNKTNASFYLEVKNAHSSQSAQFTAIPNFKNKKFIHTGVVKTKASVKIIDHMNKNFEKYSKVSTEGIQIDGIDTLLRQHFIEHYEMKKVKFIVFTNGVEDKLVDLHTASWRVRFAKYRIIGNGSSRVSIKHREAAKKVLKENGYKGETKLIHDGNKSRLYINSPVPICGMRLFSGDLQFYISEKNIVGDSWYEIRQLSSSQSPTVILTL